MIRSRLQVALAVAIVVAMSVSGCIPSEVTTSADDSVLVILETAPVTLLPYSPMTSAAQVGSLVFQGLFRTAADGAVIPDLATTVPTEENGLVSPDGSSVTVELDPDATWHDGEPVTADDVVFTWALIAEGTIDAGAPSNVANVASATAVDDHTVRFGIEEYDLSAVLHAMRYVLPEHLLGDSPFLLSDPYWASPVGSGPFEVTSFRPGTGVSLERAGDVVSGAPSHLEVVFAAGDEARSLWDDAARAIWPGAEIEPIGEEQVAETISATWRYVLYDLREDHVTSDPAVRAAMSAVTTATVVPGVGEGPFGTTVITAPAGVEWGKAVLEDAGWELGEDGVRVRDGEPLRVEFYYNPESQADGDRIDELIAAYKDLGIDVRPHATMDYATYWDPDAPLARGYFDAALIVSPMGSDLSWAWPFDPEDIPSLDLPNGLNLSGVSDASLTALQTAQRASSGSGEALAEQIEDLDLFALDKSYTQRVLFKGLTGVSAEHRAVDALTGWNGWLFAAVTGSDS